MYSEKVMDHFQHPRNVGEIEDASGVGTVGNAKCGDIMRMFLDIDDETHIIKESCYGSSGRTSAGKSTLLTSCRGSNPRCTVGLCTETRHCNRRSGQTKV